MTPFHRAAIYFMPSVTTPLGRFGASWLGRDAEGGPVAARPPVPGLDDAALHRLTAEPRRYGFHATLRAPFMAVDGLDAEGLVTAIRRLATTLAPVTLDDGLSVRRIGSFLALVPASPPPSSPAPTICASPCRPTTAPAGSPVAGSMPATPPCSTDGAILT
jgi:hypothetical protein